jgi:hypothetical protein
MYNLNESIVAYLTINRIPCNSGDYQTGQPEGEDDQVIFWNSEKLGDFPTQDKLDSAVNESNKLKIRKANKQKAIELLSKSDWSVNPDVTSGSVKLTNQQDFISYRNWIRQIAVNPPDVELVFPDCPAEVWN